MYGFGISFGVDFDSAPNSPEPKKKQAPPAQPPPPASGGMQPTFWERMFFINDAYIPDPGYERTPQTLAAHLAKEALKKPEGS